MPRFGNKPGPPPNPRSRRTRQRLRLKANVPQREELTVPPAPPDLSKENLALWESLWRSEISRLWLPARDLPALFRLFNLYEERDELALRSRHCPEIDIPTVHRVLRKIGEAI